MSPISPLLSSSANQDREERGKGFKPFAKMKQSRNVMIKQNFGRQSRRRDKNDEEKDIINWTLLHHFVSPFLLGQQM